MVGLQYVRMCRARSDSRRPTDRGADNVLLYSKFGARARGPFWYVHGERVKHASVNGSSRHVDGASALALLLASMRCAPESYMLHVHEHVLSRVLSRVLYDERATNFIPDACTHLISRRASRRAAPQLAAARRSWYPTRATAHRVYTDSALGLQATSTTSSYK